MKYSGTIEIGGSAACSIPYNACKAGCQVACIPCHIIPFVSCKVPCTDCPNACKRVFDACSGATKAEWSVNVLEVSNLANTFSVTEFDTFDLEKNASTNSYDVPVKLVVTTTPKANVDIRTTASLGNYQGDVTLGNLKVTIPLTLHYDCTSQRTTLKKLDKLEVQGVDVKFEFGGLSDIIKKEIYKLAKSKIDNTIKEKLEDQLTSLFKDFIQSQILSALPPLNITC